MSRFQRTQFKPSGPFVVRKRTVFNGEWLVPGEPLPTEGVSVRRLRQLYDDRRIDMSKDSCEHFGDVLIDSVFQMNAILDSLESSEEDLEVVEIFEGLEPKEEPKEIPLSELPDDELFARAQLATGVRYRVRARAIKALESL